MTIPLSYFRFMFIEFVSILSSGLVDYILFRVVMDTRGRKKRRVAGFSSETDFVDLEDSQSDNVMYSQYVNDDFLVINQVLMLRCYLRFLHLTIQLFRGSIKLCMSSVCKMHSVSKFATVISLLSEAKKDVIRRYGFGSLLLFDKCFVPKKFSKWMASLVESKFGDLIVHGKVISLTAKSVNLVLGIPVSGTHFPSNYATSRAIVLSKIDKTSLPQVSFFAEKLAADHLTDEPMYLDHVDFSNRRVSDTFPRIGVWKQNMIRDFSDLDIKSPFGYGMRPLLDFEKTCYHKGCLPCIPIDLVSLGALPDDLKTIFSKLMTQVYSFKQKSQELVIKVLKEVTDYESSSDPHIASPKMAAASGNENGFHQPHDSQVNVEKVERASSLAKDLGVPSSSKKQVTFGLAVPSNDLSQPYDLFHKSVHRGHLVGKSSSQFVPAHVVDDVIPVAKDHDSDVLTGGLNSPDHFSVASIVMQTLPFSDDESPNITPKLPKKLPPISQLKSSSKTGSSVAAPVNVSSPEVTIVGSRSLSQKLSSSVHTPPESDLKIGGHSSLIPNQFAQSSSKSDFKISKSSTGGKVPLHGPRRSVKPSQYMGDEFEKEREKFKVSKSQIMNYKAICNLAM
ncbi:unnamed protein product [Miscanthus lutarioriparius]|uniref:Uncharacterized protein n=1 Tax=Miscanthus lutarioriparius TaxID=422564 RepID=A0A811MCX3_9POAL|nr:unnamed protein product [Miscanthus lutarioriparius]